MRFRNKAKIVINIQALLVILKPDFRLFNCLTLKMKRITTTHFPFSISHPNYLILIIIAKLTIHG